MEALQNHGYPYAQVSLAREPIDSTRTRVVIRADAGPPGFFGPIDIVGNRRVDDRIIRRRIGYAPGEPFRRSAIEHTQQSIGALGLFKSVDIQMQNAAARPADVPTLITVEERTPWQWNLGIGYAAGERLALDARISHLNVLGSARRLDLEGRRSAIERSAALTFTQLDSWHPSLGLSLQARHREIDERSFFALSRGGQAAVTWQWTRQLATTASYAVALEKSDVDSGLEPLLGLQDGMVSAWSIDLDHRKAATGTPPSRTIALHVEQAGWWMPGTFNYVNLIGDARHYRRAFDDRVVFASRMRYGAIDRRTNEADIPLLKRFFLGGPDEMRGWGTYELAPLSASGAPIGGKSLLTMTGEARFPIFKRLAGAVFVEAGNVWQDSWTLHLDDLLYDAGPGLRIDTPFGLVRLDFGYQLKTLDDLRIDGRPQKSRWRVGFGIGEAF